MSQKLWNDAYDSLENDEETANLVKSYGNILALILQNGGVTRTSTTQVPDISAELKDRSKRQMLMQKLVKEGQERIAASSKIVNGVGNVADFILSAKDIIDTVIASVPHAAPAALPWAGVCIGLQVST